MDKKILLMKLEDYFNRRELTDGFESQAEAISWANKVAPLLKFVDMQYYQNFVVYSHKLNLNLSSVTLIPAMNIMKSQLEMAIEDLKLRKELEERLVEEIYFPENSQLDIQINIAKVIRQATKTLWICDPYMDEKIVEELTEVQAKQIILLTTQVKGLFTQRLSAAKQQYTSKTIEAKVSDQFHDRFYIIDSEQVWMLGASLNKAGLRATLLSKVKSNKEMQKIIKDFKSWWDSANPLP